MRGILLAGGHGSRLGPLSVATSKQLLPVYDKPLIFYPLSTLMIAGVREILVIVAPRDLSAVQALLGNGAALGISITYAVQDEPRGIADALVIARDFIEDEPVCLILGDNVLFGSGLGQMLRSLSPLGCATVFAIESLEPQNYAVVTLSEDGTPVNIVEKPTHPDSRWIVPGLYFYPPDSATRALELATSPRGELEITDLNRDYMSCGQLSVVKLPRGTYWIDAGTPESLAEAGQFVSLHFRRTGLSVACPEEVAFRMGWVSAGTVGEASVRYRGSIYGDYLKSLTQA